MQLSGAPPALWRKREALALHCLGLAGYDTTVRGCVSSGLAWAPHRGPAAAVPRLLLRLDRAAVACRALVRRARGLIMAGDGPARVPDAVIAELRARERDGLIELPKPPALQPGDRVRIISGPFSDHLALYEGQTAHERVAVLLQFLGASSAPSSRPTPSSRWRPCHDPAGG